MIFLCFLIYLHLSIDKPIQLYARFVRPQNNPLEIYPTSKVPLCFQSSFLGGEPNYVSKCQNSLTTINQDSPKQKRQWCTTPKLSLINISLLNYQLEERYVISFGAGGTSSNVLIGPDKNHVFSHYTFKFFYDENKKNNLQTKEILSSNDKENDSNDNNINKITEKEISEVDQYFSLVSVTNSNPVNFSQFVSLSFTYDFEFVDSLPAPKIDSSSKKLLRYFFICLPILLIISVFVLRPDFLIKSSVNAIATIPSNNFLITVMSGAGAGVLGYVIAIIFMILFGFSGQLYGFGLTIPACASALFTGLVTSLICTMCRLKDVASALYFAPLIFPSIHLAVIFSVQWIPVCLGSCFTVPMRAIFIFILSVVFVKLPVNLITGLLTGALINPPAHHTIRSVSARKFTSSRSVFISAANCILFAVIFPLASHLMDNYSKGFGKSECKYVLMFIPLWILSSMIVGIASLAVAHAYDWAMFAFISAAGSGIVLWIISFFSATISYKMTGTLQISLHMAITALVCIGLSMSAGCISVLSAVLWIILCGVPPKNA